MTPPITADHRPPHPSSTDRHYEKKKSTNEIEGRRPPRNIIHTVSHHPDGKHGENDPGLQVSITKSIYGPTPIDVY